MEVVFQRFHVRRQFDPFKNVEDDAGEAIGVDPNFLIVGDLAEVAARECLTSVRGFELCALPRGLPDIGEVGW